MAEYVRFTPEGPWHRVRTFSRNFTMCHRWIIPEDSRAKTPGDYLCKECDRG